MFKPQKSLGESIIFKMLLTFAKVTKEENQHYDKEANRKFKIMKI